MKSGPTSGPLTVSSQVIQLPHGIRPPEQFICVPFRLVNASSDLAVPASTSMVVVPPPAIASYGVPGAERGAAGPLISWLRTSHTLPSAAGERAHAVVPARQDGAVVEDDRGTRCRGTTVLEPSGRCSRTLPSRRSGMGPSSEARRRLRRFGYDIGERPEGRTPGCNRNSLQEPTWIDRACGHIPLPLRMWWSAARRSIQALNLSRDEALLPYISKQRALGQLAAF